jgi:hypothetical protein
MNNLLVLLFFILVVLAIIIGYSYTAYSNFTSYKGGVESVDYNINESNLHNSQIEYLINRIGGDDDIDITQYEIECNNIPTDITGGKDLKKNLKKRNITGTNMILGTT